MEKSRIPARQVLGFIGHGFGSNKRAEQVNKESKSTFERTLETLNDTLISVLFQSLTIWKWKTALHH